jgi:hypothetical protein
LSYGSKLLAFIFATKLCGRLVLLQWLVDEIWDIATKLCGRREVLHVGAPCVARIDRMEKIRYKGVIVHLTSKANIFGGN